MVNSSTTTIPQPQVAYQVPRPFYSHNVTPMYYAQPTHVPRIMPLQYYMPSRPRLQYSPLCKSLNILYYIPKAQK